MSMAAEGQRVDQYYTHKPQPASPSLLTCLQNNFDYLECKGCGHILETAKLNKDIVELWRFDLMGLRPSILHVAKATCPICQDMKKQFSTLFR